MVDVWVVVIAVACPVLKGDGVPFEIFYMEFLRGTDYPSVQCKRPLLRYLVAAGTSSIDSTGLALPFLLYIDSSGMRTRDEILRFPVLAVVYLCYNPHPFGDGSGPFL